MDEQIRGDVINETSFGLLSVAALLKKVRKGIGIKELHREAERKFDTLIELLSDTYADQADFARFGYSIDELKEMSLAVFNRLISDTNANPFITLCVSERASLEEIKRRRNRLLYIFHPDRNPHGLTNGDNTMKINEAYNLISNNFYRADKPYKRINSRVSHYQSSRQKKILILSIYFSIFFFLFLILMKIINIF